MYHKKSFLFRTSSPFETNFWKLVFLKKKKRKSKSKVLERAFRAFFIYRKDKYYNRFRVLYSMGKLRKKYQMNLLR